MTRLHDDRVTGWQNDTKRWWHDNKILRSHVYGLICLKLKTQLLHFKSILNLKLWLTRLLTRVKSRDASASKKLLDMVYICPVGSRGGMDNLFFWKSVFVKHPIPYMLKHTVGDSAKNFRFRDAKSEEHEERAPAIFPPAVLIFGLPTQKIC